MPAQEHKSSLVPDQLAKVNKMKKKYLIVGVSKTDSAAELGEDKKAKPGELKTEYEKLNDELGLGWPKFKNKKQAIEKLAEFLSA